MEEEQQPENSRSPQKKIKIVEFKRKKRVRFLLPPETDGKSKPYSPQSADEEMFKYEYDNCQRCGGTTSGIPARTSGIEANSHLSPCDKLTPALSNLTLSPHTPNRCLVRERVHKTEKRMQLPQTSKRMFQRFLCERTKCLRCCHPYVEEDQNIDDDEQQHTDSFGEIFWGILDTRSNNVQPGDNNTIRL